MFTLPDLPYDYKALEPFIDEETMRIHHDKHHAAYINNLNTALKDQPDWLSKPVEEIIVNLDSFPDEIKMAVRNNAGGHANHSFFWQIMTPGGSQLTDNKLKTAIEAAFGSVETLQEKINDAGIKRFGSGWTWLVVQNGNLEVMSTPNQDSPLMDGKTPLLGIDVWEHAYYLKYKNVRADYLKAWWKVVNWPQIAANFEKV